jgi:membrane associated rhomboid family serine protease
LIVTNIIVFAVFWLSWYDVFLNQQFAYDMLDKFTMFPVDIIHGQRLYTLFTSMFMHDPSVIEAGLFHLFGNMLYLYVFGDNVEDAFGHGSYLVFYLVSGLAASFTYVLTASPQDLIEGVVGASGAISGVLGAYAVLYPRSRILTLILAGFPIILPIPAVLFLGFWFVLQWLYVVFGIASGVAYFAHIGGFVFGVLLAVTVGRRRKRARDARKRL